MSAVMEKPEKQERGTFGQAKQILKVIDDAKPRTAQLQGLSENSNLLRLLVENGEYLDGVSYSELEALLAPSDDYWMKKRKNPFADEYEEVKDPKSAYTGYYGNSVDLQVRKIREIFHGLDAEYVDKIVKQWNGLPKGAETFLIWPKLSSIGRILNVPSPYTLDYGTCLRELLSRVAFHRKFQIEEYCRGLNSTQLRLIPSIARLYHDWEARVRGDFMVAPVQLGVQHAGKSARNARWDMAHSGQFALDPFPIACLMITEPGMLYNQSTFIDCPGALYSSDPGRKRIYILTFENSGHRPRMDRMPDAKATGQHYPASGFLPKRVKLR